MQNLTNRIVSREHWLYPAVLSVICVAVLLLSACATSLKPHPQPESLSLAADPAAAAWHPLHNNLPADRATSWFDIQAVGPEALRWRLALIDTATTSIDAQYFIWKNDAVGSLLLERVLQAADRGVRVRLLIDDSFLSGEDEVMLAVDTHPNVEMRIFNPFQVRSSSMLARFIENLNDFERTNHRMHNKLLISDGKAAIVGGRNIADEYFGFDKDLNFRTFDVLTTGEVLPEISAAFDVYWNSGWAFPISAVDHQQANEEDLVQLRQDLHANATVLDAWLAASETDPQHWPARWARLARTMLPGEARLLQDDPHFEGGTPPVQAADHIREIFSKSSKEVMSISAYLVPSENLLQIARELSDRGVHIRALTNSLASNNHVSAHTAYRHRRKQILEAGVELYELRPDAAERIHFEAPGFTARKVGLHAKILVLDRRLVFVGTINTDPRSMTLNTEVSLIVDSPELAEGILAAFADDFSPDNSWHVEQDDAGDLIWHSPDRVLTRQPAGGTGRRVADFFYGLFPIDSQM